jgi:putative FmdB family regulatory protein
MGVPFKEAETMPIYEYKCRACGHHFEELVRDAITPPCPSCRSSEVERTISLFSAKSDDRSRAAFKKAKQKAAKTQKEATSEELAHYYREHDTNPEHER